MRVRQEHDEQHRIASHAETNWGPADPTRSPRKRWPGHYNTEMNRGGYADDSPGY